MPADLGSEGSLDEEADEVWDVAGVVASVESDGEREERENEHVWGWSWLVDEADGEQSRAEEWDSDSIQREEARLRTDMERVWMDGRMEDRDRCSSGCRLIDSMVQANCEEQRTSYRNEEH